MARNTRLRTLEELDAALRSLFLGLEARALPDSLRAVVEQLDAERAERIAEEA